MAIQDEIYYTTPNGAKISQTEALERYGSEQFDALVNTGDLIEFQQEEEPDLNQGDSFYETPNGNVYTEGDLISQYGIDDFNSYVEGGNLKKKRFRRISINICGYRFSIRSNFKITRF